MASAVAATGMLLAGCGKNIQQATVPVTGVVEFDGKPLAGATLVFHAVDTSNFKWKELPQAFTGADGTFSVHTYASNDGAPAGDYDVGIAMIAPTQDEGEDQQRRVKGATVIPKKYADHTTSGIRVTVGPRSTKLPTISLAP
ncbi:MAG: hypothetical protein EBR86_12195 [Planctomycetia bacterium]|nr:hypothetical protein [Planctomycetia bacterium]